MIKPSNLYDATRLPADEELLNNLLDKYFSISYSDMNRPNKKLKDLLYDKINLCSKSNTDTINKQDLDKFVKEINRDFIAAGAPFKASEHGGMWNPLNVMPGWHTFKSWHLLGTERIHNSEFAHRFYFGMPHSKLYEFANILYDKFKSANIPFYFKTLGGGYEERTDNLVLYTSTPLLKKTMNVIEQVKNERPDLLKMCYEPSILTGKYDSKIGYASEDSSGKTSYTDLMCETFVLTIENCLGTYTRNNPNSKLKNIFKQKIQDYNRAGKSVDLDNIKNRILLDILIKNVPSFKEFLLAEFRKELSSKDIDIENVCFNKRVKKEIDQTYRNINADTMITLPNGRTMTQKEYLEINGVLRLIPDTSIVILKNGMKMTGKEFIKGILDRANQFNTFQELFNYYVERVDRTPGLNSDIHNHSGKSR